MPVPRPAGPAFVLFTAHSHPPTFLESAVGQRPGAGRGGAGRSARESLRQRTPGRPDFSLLQAQALVRYLEEPLTQVAAS